MRLSSFDGTTMLEMDALSVQKLASRTMMMSIVGVAC